jgi:hypothetical protein
MPAVGRREYDGRRGSGLRILTGETTVFRLEAVDLGSMASLIVRFTPRFLGV